MPIVVIDGEGGEVAIDGRVAELYRSAFDRATVSACPQCRCRMIAALAFADALDDAPPLDITSDLRELVEEAPTTHLYVVDIETECEHRAWRDPGYEEWADITDEFEFELEIDLSED